MPQFLRGRCAETYQQAYTLKVHSRFRGKPRYRRARVAGSRQETYTTLSGLKPKAIVSTSFGVKPLRGGSTITVSGFKPLLSSSAAASLASAQINSAFLMPLSRALKRASSIACGTTSTPITPFCPVCKRKPYCSRTAVKVKHGFVFGRRIFCGFVIKQLCRSPVYLIE